MSIYARGIYKTVALASEASFGVQGAGPGQDMRRTQLQFDLGVAAVDSSEITEDAQLMESGHGPQTVTGSLSGQVSPGSYKAIMEGLLRGTWTSGVSATGMSDTSVAIDVTSKIISLSSSGENFLTDGFKRGDVVRFSGLSGGPAAMNGINLRTVFVAAHLVQFAPNPSAVAYSSGQGSVTITVVGKKLLTPARGTQVFRSFSLETWQSDISESELGLGCRFSQLAINAPASGYSTLSASFTGRDKVKSGSRVYGSPTAQSTSGSVMPVNGKVSYAGTDIGYITAFNVQMATSVSPVSVIGDPKYAEIFEGLIGARGTFSCLLASDTLTNDFISEAEVDISLFLPSTAAANADFVNFYMGRAKLFSNTRQDGDRAISRSLGFTALRQINGGSGTAWDNTTIVVQDSLA